MRKVLISMLCLLPAVAAADPVSRRSADVYVSDDGRTAHTTVGCTQTASSMEGRVEVNSVTGRPHLVFYDRDGMEEADCQIVATVRQAPAVVRQVPALARQPRTDRKVAARTKQTARVARR